MYIKHAVKVSGWHCAKFMAIVILGTAVFGGSLVSANPDFSKVNDILYGERHLLPNDDLVFMGHVGFFGGYNHIIESQQVVFQTTDSKIAGTKQLLSEYGYGRDYFNNTALAVGRMFILPNDVIAYRAFGQHEFIHKDQAFDIYDPVQCNRIQSLIPVDSEVDYAAMADFNYDGFDELIVHTESGEVYIATAKNLTDLKQGLIWQRLGNTGKSEVVRAFDIFEFPDELPGTKRKAFIRVQDREQGNGLEIQYLRVDPATLKPVPSIITNGLNIPGSKGSLASVSVAVGRYGSTHHDQLAVAYTKNGAAQVSVYDYGNQHGFQRKASLDLGLAPDVLIKSGRINGLGPFHQAVVWSGNLLAPAESKLRVLTFDVNLNIANPGQLTFSRECFSDFTLGRFDPQQPPTPNLQVALL